MIAIIPCAGKGKRRAPDTDYKPKILLEHQGEPLIEHIVRPIDDSGLFEKIVFVVSPRQRHGEMIYDYTQEKPFSTPIAWSRQNEPLGFGHAVLQAKAEIFSWRRRNPPVLVVTDDAINSPVIPAQPRTKLIKDITKAKTSTLGVQWRGNVRDYGMVVLEDSPQRRRDKPFTAEAQSAQRKAKKKKILFQSFQPLIKSFSASPRLCGERLGGKSGECDAAVRNSEKPNHLPRVNSPALQIARLVEKPYWDEGGLALTGIYFIRESRRLFRCLTQLVRSGRCLGAEYQFTHALQMMIDQGTEFRTRYHEWIDCGNTKASANHANHH